MNPEVLSRLFARCGAVLVLTLVAWVSTEAVGTGDALAWTWPAPFLRDLALVTLTVGSARGLGAALASGLLAGLAPLELRLASIALGLGAQALVLFGLGVASCLSRGAIAGLLAVGLVAASLKGSKQPASLPTGTVDPVSAWTWEEALVAAAGGFAALISLRGTLLPEVFFDALHYHDSLPALFLLRHRIEVFPHAVHGIMPANINLLFLPLLAWGGASTVKLAHFFFWLGSAAWAFGMGRRMGGRLGGLVSAALVLGVPGMGVMAGFGGVDLGVTFFVLGAFSLTLAALSASDGRLLVGASTLMGVAGGAKYTVLPTLGLWAVATGGAWLWRRKEPRSVRVLAVALVVCFVVACPWYLRNWLALGNPVYPALEPTGSEGAQIVARVRADATPPGPWWQAGGDLVNAFAELRPLGAGAEVLPVSIALAVGLLWGLARREGRWLAVVAVAMLLMWSRAVQILRYAYPALGVAAALGALMVGRSCSRWRRLVVLTVVALVLVGAGRLFALQRTLAGDFSDYLLARQTSAGFLEQRLPSFRAAKWVRDMTPEVGTRLLFLGETSSYYFARDHEPVSGYNRHPLADWAEAAPSASALAAELRLRGFSHLVLNQSELRRLNARYGHCVLSAAARLRVEALLASRRCRHADVNVSIWEL